MREPEGFSRLSTLGPAPLALTCDDQFRLEATCFEAAGTPRAIAVVAGALGVPRRHYARFGEFLSAQGIACLTFDYRGAGESVPAEGQDELIDMVNWGQLDIDAAIRSAATLYPGTPIFLVGHSCGAQLMGLAASSKQLAGAIFVAPSMPHASRYPRPDRYGFSMLWRFVVPMLSRGPGHELMSSPGMHGALAPKAVYRQWASWCRSKDYLFDERFKLNTAHFAQLELPILSIGISDDEMAPQTTILPLLERYPKAQIERRIVDVQHMGYGSVGHMGFFRSKTRDALWFPVLAWMMRHRGRTD